MCILLVVAAVCVGKASAANLVTNPGFEDGITGWTTWGFPAPTLTASTAQTHTGSKSGLISGRAEYWQGPVYAQNLLGSMTPGVTYKISGWVRMETAASDTLAITLGYKISGGQDLYWGTPPVSATNTSWTYIVGYYTMPSNVTTLNLYCSEPYPPDEGRFNFYLDDVSVEAVSYTTQDVIVDLSAITGTVTYRASGFLHGLSDTDPGTGVFEPLKPRLYRFDPALTGGWGPGLNNTNYINRAANAGARLQLIVSDEYGYGYNPAGWPGDDGAADVALRTTITTLHNVIVAKGYSGIEWDIWNEPDYADPNVNNKYFWKASQAQFFKAWKVAYTKIRELEPIAVIVGPSIAFFAPGGVQGGYLKAFLSYCKTNNCLPNVLSWHEMNDYKGINAQVQLMRQFMDANGIPQIPIDLNEYVSESLTSKPGTYPWFYAALEQAAVKGAAHACWNDGSIPSENTGNVGRLDGLTSKANHLPLASWHVAKAYADMSGDLCSVASVTPITQGWAVTGVASKNPSTGEVKILLGNETNQIKTINLVIDHLDQISYFPARGKTYVLVQRVLDNGWNEVASPETVSAGVNTPTGDSLTLSLTFAANQAYIVTLSEYNCTAALSADMNNDCKVDMLDLAILATNWLK